MFLAVLGGMILIYAILMVIGGIAKKVVEVFSMLVKFGAGAALSMIIYQLQPFKFEGDWGMLIVVIVGALLFVILTQLLASYYRLIGFSINYAINSVVVMCVAFLINEKHPVSFVVCALALLLFPRLLWISDRRATESNYSHTKSDFSGDTDVYIVSDVDKWENSGDSWKHLPLQIVVSSVFYMMGSFMIMGLHPIDTGWLVLLCILLATAVNVCFDLFLFRRIDAALDYK